MYLYTLVTYNWKAKLKEEMGGKKAKHDAYKLQ